MFDSWNNEKKLHREHLSYWRKSINIIHTINLSIALPLAIRRALRRSICPTPTLTVNTPTTNSFLSR